ncbi:MAG: MOSC domain-containing protein [Candidatus Acidiferrales bacterium]
MGEVAHLFRCLVHRFPMEELAEVEAVANKGFKGCIHGRSASKRQVSLMDVETLEKLGVAPGLVKENITTRDMDFQMLGTGQILRIGDECVMEITGPCHPCPRMDEVRMGLQEELRGQRGWLCKVTVGGLVRRGDRIEVMAMAAETAAVSSSRAPAD